MGLFVIQEMLTEIRNYTQIYEISQVLFDHSGKDILNIVTNFQTTDKFSVSKLSSLLFPSFS